jgi:predicted O-methyltransferase YrrM
MRLLQLLNSRLLLAALVALSGCGSGRTPERAQSTPPSPAPSPAVAAAPAAGDRLDVPYVPTPEAVVERMLRMAKVDKDDLLYDLGSGDGRIVITAAREYGARGVGYDIDPQRIEESDENARRAGVADRVRFVRQDLFEADLSAATVVTLYLLPEVNLKLRPKLLAELKPGTLVVSHNYGMGDWEPAEVVELEAEGSTHYVYSWVVPER